MNCNYICNNIVKQSLLYKSDNWLMKMRDNATSCQDVHHSLYCTYVDIKNVVMRIYSESRYDAYQADNWNGMCCELFRPFLLRWHGVLFENVEYSGKDYTSRARVDVSEDDCNTYIKELNDFVVVFQAWHSSLKPSKKTNKPACDAEPSDVQEKS